jgi:hypothetical protein
MRKVVAAVLAAARGAERQPGVRRQAGPQVAHQLALQVDLRLDQ